MAKRHYKAINVQPEDWTVYDRIAGRLSSKLNMAVSIPQAIKMAMAKFEKSLDQEDNSNVDNNQS